MRIRRILTALLSAALLILLLAPGAGAAAGFPLTRSGSWQQMEFRCKTDPSQDYKWNVQVLSSNGDYCAVAPNSTDVLTQELPAEGMLALVLKAPGRYRVSLTLSGDESAVYEALLLNDNALQASLASARALAANPNKRYDEGYVAKLKTAIAAAEALYKEPTGVTREMMDAKISALRALAEKPVLAKSNLALINRLAPGWWKFVDAITSPFRSLQKYPTWSNFFTLLADGLRAMVNPQ